MPLTAEQDARAQQMVQRAMQDEEIPAFIRVELVEVTKAEFLLTMRELEECREKENPLLKYIGDPLFWLGLLMVSVVIWIARILMGL